MALLLPLLEPHVLSPSAVNRPSRQGVPLTTHPRVLCCPQTCSPRASGDTSSRGHPRPWLGLAVFPLMGCGLPCHHSPCSRTGLPKPACKAITRITWTVGSRAPAVRWGIRQPLNTMSFF